MKPVRGNIVRDFHANVLRLYRAAWPDLTLANLARLESSNDKFNSHGYQDTQIGSSILPVSWIPEFLKDSDG
jgi:hypothetical protein